MRENKGGSGGSCECRVEDKGMAEWANNLFHIWSTCMTLFIKGKC
jgi:hypothetical protein